MNGTNADNVEILPSTGIVIRKIGGTPGSAVWTAPSPY
jgi:hypothetical protein